MTEKSNIIIKVSSPTVPLPKTLTMDDVWGNNDKSMKVAITGQKCPIFGDILEYKSATFVCPLHLEEEVIYWIEHVYGGDCISKRKSLEDNKVALRGDYQCW